MRLRRAKFGYKSCADRNEKENCATIKSRNNCTCNSPTLDMCIKVEQIDYDCVTTVCGGVKRVPPHRDTQDSSRAEPSQRTNADTENSSITSYYSPQVHTSPHQLDVHAGERFTTFRLMSPSCVRLGPAVHPPKTHTHSKKKGKKKLQKAAAGGPVFSCQGRHSQSSV